MYLEFCKLKKKPFTEGINNNLYSKYFGAQKEERVILEISRETKKILKEVVDEVISRGIQQYSIVES